jgi:hypothetical protein
MTSIPSPPAGLIAGTSMVAELRTRGSFGLRLTCLLLTAGFSRSGVSSTGEEIDENVLVV